MYMYLYVYVSIRNISERSGSACMLVCVCVCMLKAGWVQLCYLCAYMNSVILLMYACIEDAFDCTVLYTHMHEIR